MNNKTHLAIESNYRALYGKLFSTLIKQFGLNHVSEIEDALQNAFLKSLRSWHTDKIPDNIENWLFIVARNDVINQIKRQNRVSRDPFLIETEENIVVENDLRLQTILFLASSKKITDQAKVLFILKNIFGLSIQEISDSTLFRQAAIYKTIYRAKKDLKDEFEYKTVNTLTEKNADHEIETVEEIFYAVFNIGFNSFNEKIQSLVNEDLCLEALALGKLLYQNTQKISTKNLLALFCFHLARIPAKVDKGKLVPFFKQDHRKWDKNLMNLGFRFLHKPKKLHRFYIEALIVSKYMTANSYDILHWKEIVILYELLSVQYPSPIVKLNLCYALHKAKRTGEALELMVKIENKLPKRHLYYSLVKAELLKVGVAE